MAGVTDGKNIRMRTHVEFRSDNFPALPEEDELINPGRWGKKLADYLHAELAKRGFTGKDPFAEDWGWVVPLSNPEFPLWIGCGNYEEFPDGFLCFIEPSKPAISKLFRKIDTTERVGALADCLDKILHDHSGIYGIRWWSAQEAGAR